MKYLSILMIVGLISLGACEQLNELTKFNMSYTTDFIVDKNAVTGTPETILTPEIDTDSENQFAFNSTNKDLIQEISLNSLILVLLEPVGNTFTFVEGVELYILSQGLPELKLASTNSVSPNAGSTIVLTTTGADFAEYIKAQKFQLKAKVTTDEMITMDHKVEVQATFRVDAGIL